MLRKSSLMMFLSILFALSSANSSYALEEVGSDARIRTLIYGKNDVYRITTSFGYQTTIELSKDEKIKTISLGNSSSFRITPQKNRIFVKTLQGGQLTNMVVITDLRTYQFELSSIIDSLDEIMYVVKFYYPDTFDDSAIDLTKELSGAISNQSIDVPEVNIGGGFPQQQYGSPMMPPMAGLQQSLNFTPPNSLVFNTPISGALNYNYSLTGPDHLSPTEVFDDGIRMYLKFNYPGNPIFRFSTPDGSQMSPIPINYTMQGGYYVLDGVTPVLTVYFGSEHICVYNESMNRNIIR